MRFKPAVWLAVLAAAFTTASVTFAGAGDPVRSAGTTLVDSVADAIDGLEAKVASTDARVDALDARVAELEKADPTPTPVPTDPADFTFSPAAPKVGDAVTFTVSDAKPGSVYGWDRTLDGVSEATGLSYTYAYGSTGTKTVRLYEDGNLRATHTLEVASSDPSPAPPPPPSGDALAAYDLTIQPGWLSSNDNPASNYQALWLYPQSPSTPYRSPDSCKCQGRYLLLDPRLKDADGRAGQDEWWFVVDLAFPAAPAFDPATGGKWGRLVNFHNVAGDAGPNGGVGWGFGEGTSALAVDWLPGKPAPTVTSHQDDRTRDRLMPVPARGERQTYVIHWIAGRTDGTTVRPGLVQVWANGAKVVDEANVNTVQRAQGPDGQWYVQRWMELWEGHYTSALVAAQTHRLALTRIGPTLEAALADRPTVKRDLLGSMYRASGSAPKPSYTPVSGWTTGGSRLP